MKNGAKSQYEQVKKHLLMFGKITSWDAINLYRVTRLSQYIYMMRKEGYHFNVDHEPNSTNTGWHSVYILIDEGSQGDEV